MATASATVSSFKCPVCHKDFDDPKILPCTHLACKKCVLSLMRIKGSDGGCPKCRAPIFSTRPAQGDLTTLVDALPTNFAVVALVESQQVLTSPHECGLCDDVTSTSYCLQCNVKLCKTCAKGHKKIPSTKTHVIEELNKLTPDRLAKTNRTMCKAHPDRLVEMFCPAHKEVICLMCSSTKHKRCKENKLIADAAEEQRAELKNRSCAMRQSEAKLIEEIRTEKDVFTAVRKRVKDTFDDIQKTVERRRQELEREIQAQEDAAMIAIKSKDTTRASLASNANTLEQLVSTAPQAALLAMVADLTPRLDQLQSQTATTTAGQLQVPDFTVSTLQKLKSDISSLGHISMTPHRTAVSTASHTTSPQSTSSGRASSRFAPYPNVRQEVPATAASTRTKRVTAASSQPSPKPTGAELARVLKVGDRVKPASGLPYRVWGKLGLPGAVIHTPSKFREAILGYDGTGWVDVRWDHNEEEECCRMGHDGVYELELV